MRRRAFVGGVAGSLAALAGCSSGGDGDGEATGSSPSVEVDATVRTETIAAGEAIEVDATVRSPGDATTAEVSLSLEGDVVRTRQVEIPAEGSTTVDLRSPETHTIGRTLVAVQGEPVGTVTVEYPSELHVATDGDDGNPGTEQAPLGTIQAAVDQAGPGDTVRVHPGEHTGPVYTRRSGSPDAPITITGPRDAVLTPDPSTWRGVVDVEHSHVHLTGLTIDGLLDPAAPETAASYVDKALVSVNPPTGGDDAPPSDEYLRDVVVTPHAIGNTQRNVVIVARTVSIEIGEFEVIGPAGASWLYTDERSHVGEIVYLGQAPDNVVADYEWYPWDTYDRTRDVHVHHIDNSAGHAHSELVDCKLGTSDVTIEYCTDGGGSQNDQNWTPSSIALRGHDATVRWCDLRDGTGQGIEVNDRRVYQDDELRAEPASAVERAGTGNAIYGNEVTGFDGRSITHVPWIDGDPYPQDHVCGNEVDSPADFDPEEPCPDEVPDGDGIGHTGGDSPWA